MLRIVTFGLAVAASCMPSHADWLNDLSLMPPVSVTMQARKLPPVAAPLELDEAGADVLVPAPLELEPDEAVDELLPHAASSRTTAALAVPASSEVCLTVS